MDIRTVRTRKMLIDAFEQLSEQKPYEQISVSELCELSTVRRATFYRHFEDKDDFYRFYLSSLTEAFLSNLPSETESDDLRTYTREMHRRLIAFIEAHEQQVRRSVGRGAMAGSLDMMMAQIAKGIAERIDGEFARSGRELDAPSDFTSMYYAGGMMHAMRWWLFEGKPFSAEDLERHCTEMLMTYVNSATH